LYIPINTWHNRNYYRKEGINGFNERPWGLGVGKYRYDADGDWHVIYAMAFLDSQSDVEPIVGYGFQKVWRASENVRFGLGYTAGVT
jgi:lipid IVA palmitoyltransferase